MSKFNCSHCGALVDKKAASQKYCEACSEVKSIYTKTKNSSPRIPKDYYLEAGKTNSTISYDEVWDTLFSPSSLIDKKIALKIPFDINFSKNALWRGIGRGHVFIRKEVKDVKNNLIAEITKFMKEGNITFKQNKVYVSLYVAKPNARSDAINLIDSIMDSIKEAIGVDDRWFCIERLDWTIVKENPFIFVSIGQKDEELQVCSYCGRLLPFSNFGIKSNTKQGISRECKQCLSLARKLHKESL